MSWKDQLQDAYLNKWITPFEIIEQLDQAKRENIELIEFIEEVALPPHKDSDLKSLLDTLRTRARVLLKKYPD